MKLNEIDDVLSSTSYEKYDIRNDDVRDYLAKLNGLTWRLLVETLDEPPAWLDYPSSASFIAPREEKEAWVRSYEVAAMACVSYVNGLQSESDIRDLMRTFQDELINDAAPARSALFFQGLGFYRLGQSDIARQKFSLGHSEYVLSGTVSPVFAYSRTVICGAGRRRHSLSHAAKSFGRETLSFEPRNRHLIFTSGNPPYIEKYFPNYVRSLIEFESLARADVHLHVLSTPGEELDLHSGRLGEIIADARAKLGSTLTVSSSTSPNFADMRSYYACKRFLMLDDMINSYDLVTITDIDFEVIASIDDFAEWMTDYDMAFRIAPDRGTQSWAPWLKTMAGTVAVRNTPVAQEMIGRFRELFVDLYFGKNFNWGIDQNILTEILDEYRAVAAFGNTRLKNLFRTPDIKRQK